MNTRMEKVAEDVALTALRSAGTASDPPLEPETLKEAFRARWPTQDSQRPMNDAMGAAGVKGGGKTYHCGGEKVYHRGNA